MLFATSANYIFAESSHSARIALVQSEFAWGDVDKNLARFEEKVLSIEGCDMIILPELFTSGCDMQKRDKAIKIAAKQAVAARYEEIVEVMQRWAKQSGAVIIGSTIYEDKGLFFNRLLALYPSGKYEIYDKHNCFKMGSFSPGEKHLVIELNGVRFATYICYDLRFTEWSRCDNRYDCAIYIANWPTSRAEDWNSLLRERARENETDVVAVNCVGIDPSGVKFMGETQHIAPDGSLVTKCESGAEQIITTIIKR